MADTQTPDRFVGLLAATAMGVYLLLAVGATTAITDATAACTAWPVCGDGWTLPTTVDGYVAVGHRLVALAVGLLVVATAVVGWRRRESRRVRAALAVSVLLYPVQAAVGALVATSGVTLALSVLHLAVAMVIFGGLVAALAWTLEVQTGDPDDVPESAPEPDLPPADDRSPEIPSEPVARAKATANAYFRLMKPRLMWLLCLVASAGMALAAGSQGLDIVTVLATLGGGALSIGASGTFNHVLERDIDRRMNRTSDRPLATDLVPVRNAIAFGVVLAALSLALFASVNLLAAALGLAAILFYSVVYTLILKPNTVQNTVIGGAAGALPAIIGWVAVTGSIGLGGIALATLIFLWTPAHFYNLALAYKDDYERGGFPMMPVVRGETTTRRHILWYLGATLLAAGALAASEALGWVYVVSGVLVGAVFLWAVVRLHYEQTESAAFRAFHASNAYLGVTLLAIVVDTLAI
ncbi:protoheme IX farnesyltransferase [Halogranum gelatinilyticum]|uniref:Protoheme IX farnesyltransferase n=2 Tax=Halogranum gelatinilyticum TaxID=660521 RepID=A0A1G9R7F8_9EURY|nr:protoheme IX farnesyltransferase [Halogranum gelatinilyticum]